MIDGVFYTIGDFRENVAKLKRFAKKLGQKIRVRKGAIEKVSIYGIWIERKIQRH